MNFEEAEAKFRELQARVQRGEPISRAEYEDQVQQLAVQDQNGILWEINPRTGKWMYFDGAEWVSGAPPGHENSAVIRSSATPSAPAPSAPPVSPAPSAPTAARPAPPPASSVPVPARPVAPSPPPPRAAVPSAPKSPAEAKPSPRWRREKSSAAPPPPDEGTPRAGLLGSKNREWIPLAIGAVVLLLCAVLLFIGGNFALNAFSPKPTATRTLLPLPSPTPVPTMVRLPTQPPPTATPAPVMAKIAEALVNVRAQPNTRSTILTRLKKGTQVTLVAVGPAEGNNVWYQVNLADRPGPAWIRSDTLQIISGDPKTLPPAGGTQPAPPAATKPPAGAPPPTATLTPIGVLPPTPKP